MLDAAARLEQLLPLVGEEDADALRMLRTPLLYHVGEVMHVYHALEDVGGLQFLEQMLQQWFACNGDERFRHRVGEWFQP